MAGAVCAAVCLSGMLGALAEIRDGCVVLPAVLHGDSPTHWACRVCILFLMTRYNLVWPKILPVPVVTGAGEDGGELRVRFTTQIQKHECGEEIEGGWQWWQLVIRTWMNFQKGAELPKTLPVEIWILPCELHNLQNIHMNFAVFSIWMCSCLWPRIFQLWAKFFLRKSRFWHL